MFLISNFILIASLHLFDCHLNNLLLIISTSSLGWRSRLIHPQVHHKECDTDSLSSIIVWLLFQSTHSQGVRPKNWYPSFVLQRISIHALTRSATTSRRSRPAPRFYFNPRTHKECDWLCTIPWYSGGRISIHALTRSATALLKNSNALFDNFNPRTHKECDCFWLCSLWAFQVFQSTHSQGVRPV